MSAFLMTEEYDKGPIIFKKNLSLQGSLDDILNRNFTTSIDIIKNIIIKKKLTYKKQTKNKVSLKRLSYKDNNLELYKGLNKIYDAIRMVDSKEYQKSYINLKNNLKLEFSNAKKKKNSIVCEVEITTTK